MSDEYTTQDFERIAQEIGKASGSMDSYVKAMMARQKQDVDEKKAFWNKFNTRAKEYDRNITESMERMKDFTGSFGGAIQSLNNLARFNGKLFAGAGIITALIMKAADLNETWREMTEVGQTFGGSMKVMQQAANNAGIPLELFAKLQKAHNVTIDAMGSSFWQVNKQLRQNIRVSGMYGMSMEQLGDFTASYMEVSRQNGSLQSRTTGQLTGDMKDLAVTTTALAKASDKTREEITRLATSAMSSALSIGAMRSLPAEVRGMVSKSVELATAGFAALPGKAGEYFSNFFNDSLGINSSLTQGGQTAVEAGMSGLASEMDAMSRKFRSGAGSMDDQINMQNSFIDQVDRNINQLRIQAGAGNQAAAQMLEMRGAMKKTTREELERNKKTAENTKAMTAFFASVEEIFASLKATFGKSFIDAFDKVFGGFKDFSKSKAMERLTDFVSKLGARLGTLLGTALNDANINKLIEGLSNVTSGIFGFAAAIADNGPLWIGLTAMVKVLAGSIGIVSHLFSLLGPNIQKFAGAALGAFLVFQGIKKIKNMFGDKNMVVNAQNVIVNGAGGGAGGGVGGKGKGKGFMGRMRGAGASARNFVRGGARGMGGRVLGGLGGLGRGAGRLLGHAGLLGVGLESIDYLTGDKSLNMRNLAKSGLALGGGAIGGALGGAAGSIVPGAGNIAGGIAGGIGGYSAGSAVGNWLLGSDKSPAAAVTKAAAASAAAATSIASSHADLMDSASNSMSKTSADAVDPIQTLIDEIRALRQDIRRGDTLTLGKLDNATRLLQKIEISAQSL